MAQAVTSIVRDAQLEAARVPPQSVEAEQSVLGGLLLDNTAWDKVSDVLGEADFYRSDHRAIFRHIAQLIEDNKPADALTVAENLERSGKLAEVGRAQRTSAATRRSFVSAPSCASWRRSGRKSRTRRTRRSGARRAG
jgi:replicative DNA helicase